MYTFPSGKYSERFMKVHIAVWRDNSLDYKYVQNDAIKWIFVVQQD